MIYVFSLKILLLFAFSYYSIIVKNKYIVKLIIGLILILVSVFYGFRDIVIYNSFGFTTDTYRYALVWFGEIKTINDILHGSSSWKADYLFFSIPYFVHFFSDDPNIYLFINSFISFGILFFAYYKLIDKKDFYLFPFVVFLILISSTAVANYGNLLRQGLAISLVLLSLSYMLRKNFIYGYTILILAAFSHKSVLVFFIVYFFVFHTNFKLKTYYYILLLALSFIFINIPSLFTSDFFILSEKITRYQESYSRMLFFKASILFAIIILLYNLVKGKSYSNSFGKIMKIYMLTLAIAFIFFKIEIISGRLLYYPSILLPYFVYYGMRFIKRKDIYFFVTTILSAIYAYIIYFTSSTYKTIHFTNYIL